MKSLEERIEIKKLREQIAMDKEFWIATVCNFLADNDLVDDFAEYLEIADTARCFREKQKGEKQA